MRRPQTPVMMPSSSRANPTGGQPAKPLKSILKGSKNVQPPDSYESEGEMLASKKLARSQYNIPSVPPPGSRLGKYACGPFPPVFPHVNLPTVYVPLSDQWWQCP